MCELIGNKVLLPLNSEHALFLTYLPTKGNSPLYEFYSQCFQHLQQIFFFFFQNVVCS